jgi:hypothetical protein
MTRDVVDVQLALAKQFTAEAKYPDAIDCYRRAFSTADPTRRVLASIGLIRTALRDAQ